MYKARIKILVKALGVESFKKQVEDDWNDGENSSNHLNDKEINRVKQFFTSPNYETVESIDLEDQFRRIIIFYIGSKEIQGTYKKWLSVSDYFSER